MTSGAEREPVQWKPHKTLAEKKCGIRYEDCIRKFSCENGEECWFDSEDYFYDCGPGSVRQAIPIEQQPARKG
jgi:hypothetical protein